MKTKANFERYKKYTLQLLWIKKLLQLNLITKKEYIMFLKKLKVDYNTLV